MILAIETSCDDTCAAVLDGDRLLANVISSQTRFHARYGGVVPEVASRHHLELVNTVVTEALAGAGGDMKAITRVAVTAGPGLIGALLVGVATAKAIAYAAGVPMVGVNHLHGHIAANLLPPDPVEAPFISLIASGGHTSLIHVPETGVFDVMGQTLDDAAGEALDKGARLLGLPYPGGADLDALARQGDPGYLQFPVGLDRPGNFDFSFSGVKTALYYRLRDSGASEVRRHRADIGASYQSAVVEALVRKTIRAAAARGVSRVCLAGGVSANSELRRRMTESCEEKELSLRIPPPELCTDNAAMIASAARELPDIPCPDFLSMGARASWLPGGG